MENFVFQIDANKRPLDMVHPAKARKLQSKGKVSVFRQLPYVLINHSAIENPTLKRYILKIDPGSKWTGFAIQCGQDIVFRMELKHRGSLISDSLTKRAGFRRGRRSRNTRYRKKRFDRIKPKGWLAPSLMHRLLTVETWIKRFMRWCPISTIEIEQVRFDMQKLSNSEISGVEYQQGELMGYEVKQYLLEKWGNACVYCGAENVPLEVEHIKPKSKGGSNRVGNLTVSCKPCNQKKGSQDIKDFLSGKSDLLKRILAQSPKSLKDSAAVNATRIAIVKMAKTHCFDVRCWTGGRTKFNRISQGIEKSHSADAACVGESGNSINLLVTHPLLVESKGHGSRQVRRCNASGFPALDKTKQPIQPKTTYTHCQSGDIVQFRLDKDRKHATAGTYIARIKTPTAKGFEAKLNGKRVAQKTRFIERFVHRNDGYDYTF